MVAHASVASSAPKVEINSHADSYDPEDGHRSAKTVDAGVGYQDLQSGITIYFAP